MSERDWKSTRQSPHLSEDVWELYHENSKVSRYDYVMPSSIAREIQSSLYDHLSYDSFPVTELPACSISLGADIAAVIAARATPGKFSDATLSLTQIADLLGLSYGVTRISTTGAQRRAVPSGGALYPLEIYLYSVRVDDLKAGLYHYNPNRHYLERLLSDDIVSQFGSVLLQPEICGDASAYIFIAAMFERSTIKYGNRGYRAAMIEAGHVGQNLALVSTAIACSCIPLLGYRDRPLDRLLGFDGLTASTIYVCAIGKS